MDDELKEKAESAAKTYFFGTDNIDVYCIPEHDSFLDAYEIGYDAALNGDGWKQRCEELEVAMATELSILGNDLRGEQ